MIGWYVHHQGRGHLQRARAVTEALARLGEPVTVLSSLPPEPWAAWVELPRDDREGRTDPSPGGRLHFAPVDSQGHRERLAAVAEWVVQAAPRLAVVDVSVELTVWLRTLGVPTVVMAMPGVRDDPPHALAYDLAGRIIAPWPAGLLATPQLDGRDVVHTGGISIHAGRGRPADDEIAAAAARWGDGRRVLLLGGAGGSALGPADLAAARAATPGWDWLAAGRLGTWFPDPWPLLHACDVVVTAAGQNSVADVAAAGARAVVIPEERPFGEQAMTAAALDRAGLAVVRPGWPDDWGAVLDEAAAQRPRWERWQTAGAADRAAHALVGAGR